MTPYSEAEKSARLTVWKRSARLLFLLFWKQNFQRAGGTYVGILPKYNNSTEFWNGQPE